jgi:cell division protein FtsI (penicillin-binding protein 3)
VNNPTQIRQVVRPETAKLLVQLLEKVVEKEGTGWRARIEGVRVAGKTGTSQKINGAGGYSAHGRIASFIGIVPADQPRFVILVAIDEPKTAVYGGQVAAPVFQAIARQALLRAGIDGMKLEVELASAAIKRISKGQLPARQEASPLSSALLSASLDEFTPNFVGMSLRAALRLAQHEGLRITAIGSGYVTHQSMQNNQETGERVYTLTLAPGGEVQP